MARRVRFWDLAATANSDSDWTCGIRMSSAAVGPEETVHLTGPHFARTGRMYTIEHMVRGRWTPHERDAVIVQTAQLDGRGVEIGIEEEPGASGKSQIAYLIQMLAGFRVKGVRSTGDKLTRAGPLASQMEAGNVQMLSGPWNGELIDALCSFPTEGVHDDAVDGCSGAFLMLVEAVPSVAGIVSTRIVHGGWGGRKRGVF